MVTGGDTIIVTKTESLLAHEMGGEYKIMTDRKQNQRIMIKFLIQRPIAVLMAFTACFAIGLVTYSTLPISLLRNIAIPEITIQVSAANTSARELENTIVKPLRSQLIQVSALKDIHSESRRRRYDPSVFDFGTNTGSGLYRGK